MEDYRRAMQRLLRTSPIAWWGIALGMAWKLHRGCLLGSFGAGSDRRRTPRDGTDGDVPVANLAPHPNFNQTAIDADNESYACFVATMSALEFARHQEGLGLPRKRCSEFQHRLWAGIADPAV